MLFGPFPSPFSRISCLSFPSLFFPGGLFLPDWYEFLVNGGMRPLPRGLQMSFSQCRWSSIVYTVFFQTDDFIQILFASFFFFSFMHLGTRQLQKGSLWCGGESQMGGPGLE